MPAGKCPACAEGPLRGLVALNPEMVVQCANCGFTRRVEPLGQPSRVEELKRIITTRR